MSKDRFRITSVALGAVMLAEALTFQPAQVTAKEMPSVTPLQLSPDHGIQKKRSRRDRRHNNDPHHQDKHNDDKDDFNLRLDPDCQNGKPVIDVNFKRLGGLYTIDLFPKPDNFKRASEQIPGTLTHQPLIDTLYNLREQTAYAAIVYSTKGGHSKIVKTTTRRCT